MKETQYKFEIIQKNIRGTQIAKRLDSIAFEKYASGEMTLEDCLYWFKENNHIGASCIIEPQLFEEWLGSLGYKK